MLPILFRIGPIEVPAFGFMVALGTFLGWLYFMKQFSRRDERDALGNLVVVSVLAGLIGARLNYIIEHSEEIETWKDFVSILFSRSGLVAYGGILTGILSAVLYSRKKGFKTLRILDAGAPVICIGYFFGRLGCQLAGDGDYGTPTQLPWAMAYPNGTVPTLERVHPTPLYEMILIAFIFFILIKVKKSKPVEGRIFYLFLVLAGVERFFIEFLRLNPRILWGLTEAQFVSLGLIFLGASFLIRSGSKTSSQASPIVKPESVA